jgi:NAD(P)-dependent dehydrogenase (short-subunit alcohol dehydrogenase family)
MLTFEVDLFAMCYGIKLFAHYNSRNSSAAKGGKIVITASVIALYPSAAIPQYAAAKSGCIGLVRALASLSIKHNITINAICPAVVKTGLAPKGFEKYYTGTFTPMSTIMRAYDELMSTMDGGNGQVVEAFGEQLVYREGYEVSAGNDLGSEEGWMQLYRERNIRMGIADFEAQQTNGKS